MTRGVRSDLTHLVGTRHGSWVVTGSKIASVGPSRRKVQRLTARCDCGTDGSILVSDMGSDRARGCRACRVWRKHGESARTPEWHSWINMNSRCSNPKNTRYARYGGRDITVCDRWRGAEGFANFLADMGRKPSKRHSIGRIDNDKGYTPENCGETGYGVHPEPEAITCKACLAAGAADDVARLRALPEVLPT